MRTSVIVKEIILALSLMLFLPPIIAAQSAGDYPANWCRNGLFPSDAAEFMSATVGGNWTARIHFYNRPLAKVG